MKKPNDTLKAHRLQLESRKTRLNVLGENASGDEFAPGADELVIDGAASRRKFKAWIAIFRPKHHRKAHATLAACRKMAGRLSHFRSP